MAREKLGSRLGFILLSAGCAIGIGNVWKFPYMVGQYGGGVFVLFYIVFLIIIGLPIMTMEFAVGRGAQKSPSKMFESLEKPGQKWHLHGVVCIVGNYLLMMFYTTVAGWMLYYLYASIAGKYDGLDTAGVSTVFNEMLDSPWVMVACMAIIVILSFAVLAIGLQKGLERVTKIMMPALIVLMIVLAINSILLKGGAKGLEFYFKPDFTKMMDIGLFRVIMGALTQAFFTLSLGIGSMAIFGSYIDRNRTLLGESLNVAVLDTFVALCSGLIIFPACSAYGVEVDSGPNLLFITLPNVFNNIPGGRIWGSLFFLFMVFAAFSTVLAVCENIISMVCDTFGLSRRRACLINIPLLIALSLPCTFGFNLLSGFHPLGVGTNILDLEDFIVSNFMLPLGSLVFLLFCTTKIGWGWDKFTLEANSGKGAKVMKWLKPYCNFVLPVIIVLVFVFGFIY